MMTESDRMIISEKLDGYKNLPENWDSYGAKRISLDAIRAAKEFIAILPDSVLRPCYAPVCSGSIMFMWAENGIECEIEVFSDRIAIFLNPCPEADVVRLVSEALKEDE